MSNLPTPPPSDSESAASMSLEPAREAALLDGKLSTERALSIAWGKFKQHWGALFLSTLLVWGISGVLSAVQIGAGFVSKPAGWVAGAISIFVSLILTVGQNRFALRLLDAGKEDYRAILCPDDWTRVSWVYLGAVVLMTCAIAFGLILLIVPGIYLGLRFALVGYVVADRPGIGARGALQASWDLTRGQTPELLKVSSLIFLILLLGLLCLGVGVIPASLLAQLVFAAFYRTATQPNS